MTAGQDAFISASEFEAEWRALSAFERKAAATLLAAAARRIRREWAEAFDGAGIPDDRLADARDVSIDVVKTAMATEAYRGFISFDRAEGPRSKGGRLANPGGALQFTDEHREQLGIPIHASAIGIFDGGCEDARW